MPINRDTTPAWLLPGPLRRLRLLLRQTRDDAADTRQQVIEARAEQNANLARVEARLQEIAGQAHATRDAHTEAEQAVGATGPVKLFTSVFDNSDLLPHFLRHYSQAGVVDFYIATPSVLVDVIGSLVSDYNVTIVPTDPVGDPHSAGAAESMDTMRRSYQDADEWVIVVDVDEFIHFPEAIVDITAAAEVEGANVVRGVAHDRFSADGHLLEVEPESDLATLFPVRARFVRDVMQGCEYKRVLVKGPLESMHGADQHMFDGEKVASGQLVIDRYVWTKGSVERLRALAQTLKEAGGDQRIEYDRALHHYDARGRFAWEEFGGELCIPEWEFVPEGWARSGKIRGWGAEEVARTYAEKWPEFLQAVEGPGPLGVSHEVPLGTPVRRDDPLAQNAVLAWGYVLAHARQDAFRTSVLDWGGALGPHYVLARKLFPEIELDYHCRELPAVCDEGRQVLADVTFHEDDRCLSEQYDVVLASNSLQYEDDWPSRLEDLAGATHGWLFLTRVPVARSHRSFVVLQRAYRYGYGTEYLGWVVSREELLDAVRACGLVLVREFALLPPFSIDGAPDTVTDSGFLFRRFPGDT